MNKPTLDEPTTCTYPGQQCTHRSSKRIDRRGHPFYRYPPACRLFRRLVIADNGCWIWKGSIHARGYGQINIDAWPQRTHRVAYEILVGPIPDGLDLDHLCHTRDLSCPGGQTCLHRRCANPCHLEPVTTGENTRRGGARRTHCPHGHPYDEENTVYEPRDDGKFCRKCRICLHARSAARAAAAKAERHRKRAQAAAASILVRPPIPWIKSGQNVLFEQVGA